VQVTTIVTVRKYSGDENGSRCKSLYGRCYGVYRCPSVADVERLVGSLNM